MELRGLRLGIALVCLLGTGCEDIAKYIAELSRSGPRPLSDEDAFAHMSRSRTRAPRSDVASVRKVIGAEVDASMGKPRRSLADDPRVVNLLRRSIHTRLAIDTRPGGQFERVDFERFGAAAPMMRMPDGSTKLRRTCDASTFFDVQTAGLRADYMIPYADKVPVRNQGGRGTCASFAGVGSLEYAMLNSGMGNRLPTVDLSEQYFYFSSKPDCQGPTGCECPGCQEGSWYTKGFEASRDAVELDIPLETDCPYSNQVGRNDTQYPLASSCATGAIKVDMEVREWCGLQELIGYLEQGWAVPYASPLSGNWESNDGLITKRDLDGMGGTVHAGGHAYLIVGYKLLPDMPNEGGICFYIKNSWGTGWGASGYSCMTLAWMREVNFDFVRSWSQPVVTRVRLRDDLSGGTELPPDNMEAEAAEAVDPDQPEEVDYYGEEELPPEEVDLDPEPEEEEGADGDVVEEPDAAYEESYLLGPNESYYRVQVARGAGEVAVRSHQRGGGGMSRPLVLEVEGDRLLHNGDVVGELAGDEVKLCSGEYEYLCSLRQRMSDGQLYVQFRDDDLRRVPPEEYAPDRGRFERVTLDGRDYDLFVPDDVAAEDFLFNPKTLVRVNGGTPLRLALELGASLGQIPVRIQGYQVGVVDLVTPSASAICSGPFAAACVLVGATEVFVIPSNRRR